MENDTLEFLKHKLNEAESRLSKKTEQKNKLTTEIAELEDRVNVLKLLYDEAISEHPKAHGESKSEQKREAGGMTTADYAYVVMKEAGGKMHVRDIATRLMDEGKMNRVQHPQSSVHSALTRRKQTFELLGNGLWRIRDAEYEQDQKNEPIQNDEDVKEDEMNKVM